MITSSGIDQFGKIIITLSKQTDHSVLAIQGKIMN